MPNAILCSSSGRWYPRSMASTRTESTTAKVICSSSESPSTTTRLPVSPHGPYPQPPSFEPIWNNFTSSRDTAHGGAVICLPPHSIPFGNIQFSTSIRQPRRGLRGRERNKERKCNFEPDSRPGNSLAAGRLRNSNKYLRVPRSVI